MKLRALYALIAGLLITIAWLGLRVNAQNKAAAKAAVPKSALAAANPPASIPTFSTERLGREGFFYVGGSTSGEPGKEVMHGAMYVEVWVPKQIRQPYPSCFSTATARPGPIWRQTPDGRPGWAYYLRPGLRRLHGGLPGARPLALRSRHGRQAWNPHRPRTRADLDRAGNSGGDFPRMKLYTQWPSDSPKKGMMGDPVFDNFIKGQMQFVGKQAELAVPAGVALLDKIGSPVILLTHSQGGGIGFNVADQRPNLIAGMVAIEPGGPQIGSVDRRRLTYTRKESQLLGTHAHAHALRSAGEQPADLQCLSGRQIRAAGR